MIEQYFPVLLVCSGNVCRSPLAEQLLRARAREGGPVRFSSAGTIAVDGMTMCEEEAVLSTRYGGDPSAHAAKLLRRLHVRDSGLVLTASRAHRAAVVELFPRAVRYTFTLREFARLAEATMADLPRRLSGAELVSAVAARRGHLAPVPVTDDDIPDPFRRALSVHERAAALIDEAVSLVVEPMNRIDRP